jgi:hypothetical protein
MAKLKVSVNKNETKEGVKVQFEFPNILTPDEKAKYTNQLQKKLNQSLAQFNLTVSKDTDVPKSLGNVLGFTIPIGDIQLLIQNALKGSTPEAPAPEAAPAEAPASEEPVKEIKRMQELAGLKEGRTYWHVLEDSGYGNIGHQGVYDTKEEAQAEANRLSNMFSNSSFYIEASNSEAEPYSVTV